MDQRLFSALVKDILNNLYDYAALEAHPVVFSVMKPPAGYAGTRVEFVRSVILEAIEGLRPPQAPQGKMNLTSAEWRPYLLLHKRYVEGMGLKELSSLLAIGDRQMRRDHHRALLALTHRIWSTLFPDQLMDPAGELQLAAELPAVDELVVEDETAPGESLTAEGGVETFETFKEQVDLNETVQAVLEITNNRARTEVLQVISQLADARMLVETDRVILRQILISLVNEAISLQKGRQIWIETGYQSGQVEVRIRFSMREAMSAAELEQRLQTARYWCRPIGAALEIDPTGEQTLLAVRLPVERERSVLVIDDQPLVLNLFRRFLSHSSLNVIGAAQADEIFNLTRLHHPVLIILDVMMPQVDGWEILQRLKVNEDTRQIPVVICSAWAAPDLAYSLGATAFLKKPVTQKAVIEVLNQLGIPIG